MPNKKNKNNKFKLGKLNLKKGLATVLASTLGISSGAALVALNSEPNVVSASGGLSYMNDGDINNQTRIMMDGNNMLKNGFWMNAVMTAKTPATTPATYEAKLKFTIPGYDMSNLKIFIMSKNPGSGFGVQEYKITSGPFNSPSVYVPELKQGAYNVHVYNGTLAEENFVCKADFEVSSNTFSGAATTVNLLDGAGAPVRIGGTVQQLTYFKADPANCGATQAALALPIQLIPYNAQTIKVVFFATNRDGESINIDQTLYDYSWFYANFFNFYPDANWGIDAQTTYEAHFYKDEVKAENFICKAEGLTLS